MRLHPNGLAVASYPSSTTLQEVPLEKVCLVATVLRGFFLLANLASAQQADAMIGFGTVVSPGAAACGESVCLSPVLKKAAFILTRRRRDLP